jgi:hypothetical protein
MLVACAIVGLILVSDIIDDNFTTTTSIVDIIAIFPCGLGIAGGIIMIVNS